MSATEIQANAGLKLIKPVGSRFSESAIDSHRHNGNVAMPHVLTQEQEAEK
ncbi:hypothetical protein C4K23_1478 [Pseudomonas chlororaphis]|nr:hypothetical protein C4K23_1478 [Pseudomonas chlororaphis]ETD37958.1 hypothetical protein U724_15415 [Pseudomonas chlororaphis subsp. aurantiaca PB-St2]